MKILLSELTPFHAPWPVLGTCDWSQCELVLTTYFTYVVWCPRVHSNWDCSSYLVRWLEKAKMSHSVILLVAGKSLGTYETLSVLALCRGTRCAVLEGDRKLLSQALSSPFSNECIICIVPFRWNIQFCDQLPLPREEVLIVWRLMQRVSY